MNTMITINMNNAALGALEHPARAQRSERGTRHLGLLEAPITDHRAPSTTSAEAPREHAAPAPTQLLRTFKTFQVV